MRPYIKLDLLKWGVSRCSTRCLRLTTRNFVLKHRVFLLRNWEKMREKQELLKREGERERDASSLSIYARWGGVIRDDGNIKSGKSAALGAAGPEYRGETCQFWG